VNVGSTQDISHQDEVGTQAEAESTTASVGSNEDWQHNQIQLEETSLEAHQAEAVARESVLGRRLTEDKGRETALA
jgi:hypothetical protein